MIRGLDRGRRRDHPDEPWLWRRDWSEARIPNSLRRSTLSATWYIGLAAVVGSMVIGKLAADGGDDKLALYALVAMAPAATLFVRFLKASRIGATSRATFHMREVPAQLGDWLEGHVAFPARVVFGDDVRLKIRCLSCTRGRNATERVLWEEILTVPRPSLTSSPNQSTIPVRMQIPVGCRPTATDGSTRWEILMKLTSPTGNHLAQFDIPVFR